MQVQPIQQHANNTPYNCRKTHFKGEFVYNEPLNILMRRSNIGGLKRFEELVKCIQKVRDNLIFWVERDESEYEIHNGCDTAISEYYYLHKQNGQDKKTDTKLINIYEETPYSAKLSEINEALEQFYKNDIPAEDRNRIIEEIKKILIE